MKALSESEIVAALAENPLWALRDGKVTRQWSFPDFAAAMVFVNHVAAVAEKANHHPDIDIRYNQVTLGLVTHDAGGVTQRDLDMATRLTHLCPSF